MFTGIVEETGTIIGLTQKDDAYELQVKCATVLKDVALGDSIAVDGICLTVTAFDAVSFTAFASAETLRCTNLCERQVGDQVNLERPLTLDKKLGGHMVQGHVDGTGRVGSVKYEGESQIWQFLVEPELARYLVRKGSVTVDGISLTVVDAGQDSFTVAVIPKTLEATTLRTRKTGQKVNIETDIIGKYVYKYMHPDQ